MCSLRRKALGAWTKQDPYQWRCKASYCTGTQPACQGAPACTGLQLACHLAKLFFQLEILQLSEVSLWFTYTSDKSSRFWLMCLRANTKKKKLRRLERVCLCQAPENYSMAIFKNCLFQIIDENTSVKNMINVLQTINVCLIHSCLVDVYRSQIPYRRVICWLVYFWFIPFYTAEGQNQYFARRAISTNNKQRTTLSVWPTVLRALPSKFF